MPKIRSASGKVYDTDSMSNDQLLSIAAALEDGHDDCRTADELTRIRMERAGFRQGQAGCPVCRGRNSARR